MAVRYGRFLLNQNIGQLLVGLGHGRIDCRRTLSNLLQLMQTPPLAPHRRQHGDSSSGGDAESTVAPAVDEAAAVLSDKLSRLVLQQQQPDGADSIDAPAIDRDNDVQNEGRLTTPTPSEQANGE